ncbi:hypothetical protein SLNSH_01295 [Alsobacter soli]|uniref:Uncharacterized protein n=1 Tax=Alsobacter soli TaxID=2109933 RepID=A0A2T1I006_9HYPH|nr:hypothetical protein [Alsobacter soli]PSC07039.1 hypothetical protein SLNSH_01295 [Alsobacter soli]
MVGRQAVPRPADVEPAGAGVHHPRFGWAGLALGPGAWAVNTQANLTLTPFSCGSGTPWPVYVSIAMAVLSLAGAAISAVVFSRAGGLARYRERGDGRPGLFLAGVGIGAGALFAIVILTQGAAGLVFIGCER